jgi:hypothetical protein
MTQTADNRDMDVSPDNPTTSPSAPGRTCSRPALLSTRSSAAPAVMPHQNERSRTVIDGRRTDDGDRCALIVIQEVSGVWALYPHGVRKFGVRLTKANADVLAQAILKGTQ